MFIIKNKSKRSNFVINFVLITLFFFTTFYIYLNHEIHSNTQELDYLNKEISLKVIRNSIYLLSIQRPVEMFIDYPVNISDLNYFLDQNFSFCNKEDYIIKGLILVDYNDSNNCIYFIKKNKS